MEPKFYLQDKNQTTSSGAKGLLTRERPDIKQWSHRSTYQTKTGQQAVEPKFYLPDKDWTKNSGAKVLPLSEGTVSTCLIGNNCVNIIWYGYTKHIQIYFEKVF